MSIRKNLFILFALCGLGFSSWAEITEVASGNFRHDNYFNTYQEASAACTQALTEAGYEANSPLMKGHVCFNRYPNLCFFEAGWMRTQADTPGSGAHLHLCWFPMYRLDARSPSVGDHCAGNPIDLESGSKIESVMDIQLKELSFKRYYSSQASSQSMGMGWRHSFDIKLNAVAPSFNPDTEYSSIHHDDTVSVRGLHPESACSAWLSLKGTYLGGKLSHTQSRLIGDSTCEIIDEAGERVAIFPVVPETGRRIWKEGDLLSNVQMVSLPNGSSYVFLKEANSYNEYRDRPVKLVPGDDKTVFIDQDEIQYSFEDGLLSSIAKPYGEPLHIVRDQKNRISEVVRRGISELKFHYNSLGQLETVFPQGSDAIHYSYDAGRLVSVASAEGKRYQYHYEHVKHFHALTGITDSEGNRFATWDYDANGRAIASEHAGGAEAISIDYANFNDHENPRLKIKNALGKETTYHYGAVGGYRKVKSIEGHASTNCTAANKSYEYYENDTIESKTDWKGNVTTFIRDDLGRETSRTEAAGAPEARTITTEYHPTFNKPVKITEPGKVTTMTYDAEGRLLSNTTQPTAAP